MYLCMKYLKFRPLTESIYLKKASDTVSRGVDKGLKGHKILKLISIEVFYPLSKKYLLTALNIV